MGLNGWGLFTIVAHLNQRALWRDQFANRIFGRHPWSPSMLCNSVSYRHLAVAVFIAVIAVCSPAKSEIEKFMRVCSGKLCPYYRASVAVPEGWQEDEGSSRAMNVQIFVPQGKTFDNAGAIIYTTVQFNRTRRRSQHWLPRITRTGARRPAT